MTDSWPLVHAERAALVQDLQGLRPEQWEVPSLCAGWSVHDVVAHLVDNALTTRLGFVLGLVRARSDLHGEDVRRPLGLHRDCGTESLERALRVQASTPAGFGGVQGAGAAGPARRRRR